MLQIGAWIFLIGRLVEADQNQIELGLWSDPKSEFGTSPSTEN